MEYEIIINQNFIDKHKEFINFQGGKPIFIYCFKPGYERKNICGLKPKNSASNKSRNNIRKFERPNYRAKQKKNELDFLN